MIGAGGWSPISDMAMRAGLLNFPPAGAMLTLEGGAMRDLKVEVVKVTERCGARHRIGDTFTIRGMGMLELPAGKKMCLYALNSLFPFLTAKQREDELPQDDWIAETRELSCPDPRGIVFRVQVLGRKEH